MRFPSQLTGLLKFTARDDWKDAFAIMMERHGGVAADELGLEAGEMLDLLDDADRDHLYGTAMEDLWATSDLPGGNVIGSYLKRRGFKESAGAKRLMKAMQASTMRLYDVVDVVPGQSVVLRDTVSGADPVRVMVPKVSWLVEPGDYLAARLLGVADKWQLNTYVLPFSPTSGKLIKELLAELHGYAAGVPLPEGLPADVAAGLAEERENFSPERLESTQASLFTTFWLRDRMADKDLGELPQHHEDGEPFAICIQTIDFAPAADVSAMHDRLLAHGDVETVDDDTGIHCWRPAGEDAKVATFSFCKDRIEVCAGAEEQVARATVFLMGLLGEQACVGELRVITSADIAAAAQRVAAKLQSQPQTLDAEAKLRLVVEAVNDTSNAAPFAIGR